MSCFELVQLSKQPKSRGHVDHLSRHGSLLLHGPLLSVDPSQLEWCNWIPLSCNCGSFFYFSPSKPTNPTERRIKEKTLCIPLHIQMENANCIHIPKQHKKVHNLSSNNFWAILTHTWSHVIVIIKPELLWQAAGESHATTGVSISYICRVLGHLSLQTTWQMRLTRAGTMLKHLEGSRLTRIFGLKKTRVMRNLR